MNNVQSAGTPWFGISLGLMGIIVGYAIGTYNAGPVVAQPAGQVVAQPTVPDAPAAPSNPATVDDDAVLGDDSAKVTIVEFTDYQCPFCSRHYTDTYGQIKKDYIDTGKIKYVTRDFPLSFHPHAEVAAEASECAADQGKFWEMHDKLFGGQASWSNLADAKPTFTQYATDLKLDVTKFNDCVNSGKYKEEVQKDMADGMASGVNGTPGFWVLGPDGKTQLISGAVPYATFKQAVDAML